MIGEVKVEFLVNEAGTLRTTFFNRQNEIQYTQEEQGYTQGVGLSYQINFNNFKDFLEKIGLRKVESVPTHKKNEQEIELNEKNIELWTPNI